MLSYFFTGLALFLGLRLIFALFRKWREEEQMARLGSLESKRGPNVPFRPAGAELSTNSAVNGDLASAGSRQQSNYKIVNDSLMTVINRK